MSLEKKIALLTASLEALQEHKKVLDRKYLEVKIENQKLKSIVAGVYAEVLKVSE